jgi:hypothetical protein
MAGPRSNWSPIFRLWTMTQRVCCLTQGSAQPKFSASSPLLACRAPEAVAYTSIYMPPMRRVFPPPSDTARAAALLEREALLTDEARHLTGASDRRRCEIEGELVEIRRLLEGLGLRDKNPA